MRSAVTQRSMLGRLPVELEWRWSKRDQLNWPRDVTDDIRRSTVSMLSFTSWNAESVRHRCEEQRQTSLIWRIILAIWKRSWLDFHRRHLAPSWGASEWNLMPLRECPSSSHIYVFLAQSVSQRGCRWSLPSPCPVTYDDTARHVEFPAWCSPSVSRIRSRRLSGQVVASKCRLAPDQWPMGETQNLLRSIDLIGISPWRVKQKLESLLLFLHAIKFYWLTQFVGTSMTAGNENRAVVTGWEEANDAGQVFRIVQIIENQ